MRLEKLEPRHLLAAGPVISEFMALNETAWADDDGDFSDWLEIYNPTGQPIDLDGWYLTDDADDLTQWPFPDVTVQPGEYLPVFASGKNRRDPALPLHTNFQLAAGGEYLGLVESDGVSVTYTHGFEYPQQYADVSYGLVQDMTPLVSEAAKLTYLVPTAAEAGLGTDWTDSAFNDSDWNGYAKDPTIAITEAGTGTPDSFEIQNVSDDMVLTNGWTVVANNAQNYDINEVHALLWDFPASMAPGELIYRPDTADDNIFWRAKDEGWVMILDDRGMIIDFVIWGYDANAMASFNITAGAFANLTIDEVWSGASVSPAGAASDAMQRIGSSDQNNASDWTWMQESSGGASNDNLILPFESGGAAPRFGIGFTNQPDDFGGALRTDVRNTMQGVNASLWTRTLFTVSDLDSIEALQLQMKYNDGFVAYINGQEVARSNAPETLVWNSTATGDRSYADSLQWETINLSDALGALRSGTNVLAVHGLNAGKNDADFLVLPELVAVVDADGLRHYFVNSTPGATNTSAMVVINEIHYDPNIKTELVEFVELLNIGATTADLSGSYFSKGIDFTFPDGTELAPGEYLVVSQDPAAVQNKYQVSSLGPFVGRLASEGETIVLRDPRGFAHDRVDYKLGFPWPTVGDEPDQNPGKSIELVNPAWPNDIGGNWRPSEEGPTPGAENSATADNVAPQMRQVSHSPKEPTSGEDVTITIKVTDPQGVASVDLAYQLVDPGNYIALGDSQFENQAYWTNIAMHDDGINGDALAGDDIYSVVLPGSLQQHRRMVRYRITSEDTLGASVRGPYLDDPQPNFAYFVYDGIPGWTGADRPGVTAPKTFSAEVMDSVPAYHLIADAGDVQNSQYNGSYEEARFNGTLVYDGEVYDHIEYHVRGEFSTYYSGKNKWKFHFTPGHDFQARDNFGQPYKAPWTRMNFSAVATPWMFVNRGMAGIGEAGAHKLYDLAGVPSSNTNYVHFRVIDDAQEAHPSNQYEGDLWGLYLTLEQPDGRFLDQRDLPDGNVYKMEWGGGDKKNQGPTQPSNNSDLTAFQSGYNRTNTVQWWEDNLDLEGYYSFRAINRIVNNMDLREGWNSYTYHNPETDLWSVMPWDLDMLYIPSTHWSGVLNIQNVLNHQQFSIGYKNRGREIQDLLASEDQIAQLYDELASFVNPPGEPLTFVDVDQFMWNYNSKSSGAHRGTFYKNPNNQATQGGTITRTLVSADHEGMLQWVKDFTTPGPNGGSTPANYGANFLESEIADSAIPNTPAIAAIGEAITSAALIPRGADWRYLDDGSDQDTAWREPGFNDAAWSEGPAQLGYGDGDEATEVGYGGDSGNKHITTYFRHEFNVNDASSYLDVTLRLLRDDGAVVYLNGQELLRSNMPTGAIDYQTTSSAGVVNAGEDTFYEFAVDPALLVDGSNVLAVEIHQTGSSSSDISFDLEMEASLPVITVTLPVDDLIFQTTSFSDPQGAGSFEAMEWRVGEISDPEAPSYDPTAPKIFEINAIWESGELSSFNDQITVPADSLEVGHAYRARVRMQDNTGRWSHWSDPVQFIAGPPTGPPTGGLRITEINYNPADPTADETDAGFVDNDAFEFVELLNTGSLPIDLTGVQFTAGIDFDFTGSGLNTLTPGQYVVVAKDPAAFAERYGSVPNLVGPYPNQLNNGGEQITLTDAFGQTLLDFIYGDSGDAGWPNRADGNGATLELIAPAAVPQDNALRIVYLEDGNSWRSSSEYLGSPGSAGAGPLGTVVVNEVLSHTPDPAVDAIELYNPTDSPIALGGWWLSDSSDDFFKFRIPGGTTIPAYGYATFYEGHYVGETFTVDQTNEFGGPGMKDFALSGSRGDDVWLLMDPGGSSSLRFADHVEFGGSLGGEPFGRWPDGTGDLYPMTAFTPDEVNSGPRPPQEVVISEVMYNPPGDDDPDELEFVEIYNTAVYSVDLTGWRLRKGFDFDFAPGTMLDARSALVIVSFDPSDQTTLDAFRAAYGIGAEVTIVGNPNDTLSDTGERLQLQRPDTPPLDDPLYVPHVIEDEVDYLSSWQATTDGGGDSLNRTARTDWGNDASSWTAEPPTPGTADALRTIGVAGRYVFYNNSSLGSTIATDKAALLPGEQATLANYTSYVHGINGIIIDIAGMVNPGAIDENDFTFKLGNDDTPGNWIDAPAPADIDATDGRITLTWDDGAIRNTWLEVTVLVTGDTGLSVPDVSYFGNAVGETGNSLSDATVDAIDVLATRQNPQPFFDPAAIDNVYDFNRDQRVNAIDTLIARNNQTWSGTELELIDLTTSKGAVVNSKAKNAGQAPPLNDALLNDAPRDDAPLNGDRWIGDVDPGIDKERSSKLQEQAIDRLLATLWS